MTRNPLVIERVTEEALPSARSLEIGAWRAHLGDGYIRRLNSTSLHGERPPADQTRARISRLADAYGDAGLRPMFRQTSLDDWLDQHVSHWAVSGETIVMVADPGTGDPGPISDASDWIDWIEAVDVPDGRRSEAVGAIRRIDAPSISVFERIDDLRVGSGRAVHVDGYVGLYDIQVLPGHRRAGLGRRITRRLMAWAGREGAHTVFLQVAAVNLPARELYGSLGFEEHYRYRYRRPA